MAATVKCDTIVNASSATNNLSLDASGNVTVGAGLTLTGGALNVGGSVGTAGQILKSNGTTSSWVNGWTLINTVTGTSTAALQDTTSLTSTYANYMIIGRNLLPSTNATTLGIQLYSGGAYQTSSYNGGSLFGNPANGQGVAASTYIPLALAGGSSSTYPTQIAFYIHAPSATGTYKPVSGSIAYGDIRAAIAYFSGMTGTTWTGGTGAITGLQIYALSGNINGTMQIYGSN